MEVRLVHLQTDGYKEARKEDGNLVVKVKTQTKLSQLMD